MLLTLAGIPERLPETYDPFISMGEEGGDVKSARDEARFVYAPDQKWVADQVGLESERLRLARIADINWAVDDGGLVRRLQDRGKVLARLERARKVMILLQGRVLKTMKETVHANANGRPSLVNEEGGVEDYRKVTVRSELGVLLRKYTGTTAEVAAAKVEELEGKLKVIDAKLDELERRLAGKTHRRMMTARRNKQKSAVAPFNPAVSQKNSFFPEANGAADPESTDGAATPIAAFVTFENEIGVARAVRMFSSSYFVRKLCTHSLLKFHGRSLRVTPAPEPTDIVWENMAVSRCSFFMRSCFTAIVALTLVLATAVVILYAEAEKLALRNRFETGVDCAVIDNPLNKTAVLHDVEWQYYGHSSGGVGRLECFCREKMWTEGILAVQNTQFFSVARQQNELWCEAWLTAFSSVQLITLAVSAAVVVANVMLRIVMRFLVSLEGHKSHTSLQHSLMWKLFLSMLLNTAFIVLLVNMKLSDLGDVQFFSVGQYSDFTVSWYSTVGLSLLLTLGLQVIAPHIYPLTRVFWVGCLRCCDRRCTCKREYSRKITQTELHKLYSGPEFDLAERYAAQLNILFTSFIYSFGLPLALPVALLSLLTKYWMDKLLFTRFYRLTRTSGPRLALTATSLLPIAIL
ncbi:unnamed protein product, partial [Symbiodinium sp. KB8]